MLLGGRLLRERPGQHEFRLEDRPGGLDNAVERRRHPADRWMPNPALDVLDGLSSCLLEPAPIERLGGRPKLDEEVIRVIWRLRLAALLSPKAQQRVLIVAHDHPGVRSANKSPAVRDSRDGLFRMKFQTWVLLGRAQSGLRRSRSL